MSKARLVIATVVTEARSQGEAARAYGVSQGWVIRLVARYRTEGAAEAALRARIKWRRHRRPFQKADRAYR
jgi:transposase